MKNLISRSWFFVQLLGSALMNLKSHLNFFWLNLENGVLLRSSNLSAGLEVSYYCALHTKHVPSDQQEQH